MSDEDPQSHRNLNSEWLLRENLLEQFELKWQSNGPQNIDSFIRALNVEADDTLLIELVKLDMEYRWIRGDRVAIQWYLTLYPSLAHSDKWQNDLQEAEKRLTERIPNAPMTSNGNYLIGDELGRGGFATVYRARDVSLQRDVAIKRLHPQYCNSPELRERLVREARAVARLRHPGIVPVFDIDEQNSQPSIVMALVNGKSLSDWMRHHTPSLEQAARWTMRIADALQYAHDNGIIHRDVKSSNILMQRTESLEQDTDTSIDTPLLSDFGLALHLDAGVTLTQSGESIGTPAYAAPELISGHSHHCDHRADVYSLGIVLYELLCGRVPFEGTTVQIFRQVLDAEPKTPRSIRSNVPRDLETICLKSISKSPTKRYQSAGEMASDLRSWLEKRPIRARRSNLYERMVLLCQKYPALATTILIASLSLVLVSAYSFVRVLEERDRYLSERNRAQESLYSAILSDVRSQMQARNTQWWWHAMESIGKASSLNVPNRNPRELRELAIECMGTEYPCFRMLREFSLGSREPSCIALSPDGLHLAIGTSEFSVEVLRTDSGERIVTLPRCNATIVDLAFRPNDSILACADASGKLQFWDLNAMSQPVLVHTIEYSSSQISVIGYSPDGTKLAIGCADGSVQRIELGRDTSESKSLRFTRIEPLVAHAESISCLAFSSDGMSLVTGGLDQLIRVWNWASNQSSHRWTRTTLPTSVAFSNQDQLLVVADSEAFGYSTRHLSTSDSRSFFQIHSSFVSQLQVLSSGNVLTSSYDGSMRVWQPRNVREIAVASGQMPGVLSFEMHPDEKHVYALYRDGVVRVWEFAQPEQRHLLGAGTQNAVFAGATNRLVDASQVIDFGKQSIPSTHTYTSNGLSQIEADPKSNQVFRGDMAGNVVVSDIDQRKDVDRWNVSDSQITSLAMHRISGCLAVASVDGTLTVWEYPSKRPLHRLQESVGRVAHLDWAMHGNRLALSGSLGSAIWNIDGPQFRPLPSAAPSRPISMSADYVAYCLNDSSIAIVDQISLDIVQTIAKNDIDKLAIAFSNDGTQLAFTSGRTIEVWDTKNWTAKHQLICEDVLGAPTWISWESHGRYLVAGGDRHSAIWDMASTSMLAWTSLRSKQGMFTADEKTIVLRNEHDALLAWPLEAINQLREKSSRVARDRESNAVRAEVAKIVVPGGHTDQVWGIAASPNELWFATASHDATVKLWDANSQQLLNTFEGQDELAWCVAFSVDSKQIAAGGNSAMIWDVQTGQTLFEFRDHRKLVSSVVFHPNGKWIGSCSADGNLALRDLASGELLCLLETGSMPLHCMDFSPDGKVLVAACGDQTIQVWQMDQLPFPSLSKNTDKDEIAALRPKSTHMQLRGHTSPVRVVRFSPDGTMLASGANQGSIILWDGKTFERKVELRGGTGQIRGLSFSKDGRFLAGAAYVAKTIVWDLTKLRRSLRSLRLDW